MTAQKPTIGQIVHYRGKLGLNAVRPAMIIVTVDNLEPRGVEDGLIAPLSSDTHVHLHVFTPSEHGSFTEYNVPLAMGPTLQPGEWAWPPRV